MYNQKSNSLNQTNHQKIKKKRKKGKSQSRDLQNNWILNLRSQSMICSKMG